MQTDVGAIRHASYERVVLGVAVATGGARLWPVSLSATYGRLRGTTDTFEQFALGGARAAIVPDDVLAQRIVMPALPTGTLVGNSVASARAGTALFGVAPFYWVGNTSGTWSNWHRVYGAEWSLASPVMPALALPGGRVTLGAGRSLDAPFARHVRGWILVTLEP